MNRTAFTALALICATVSALGQDTPAARLAVLDEQTTYQRAYEAALWAMPVADTLAPRRAGNERGIRPSAIFITEERPTGKLEMVTCNAETPYIFGDLTTQDAPIVFEVPPASDKAKFSGSIVDAWWKPLEDIGPDGADAGKGGKYLVLPPDYQGKIPDGYIALRSRTYRINELLRAVPAEKGDAGWVAAVAYAKTLKVYPLAGAAPKPVAFVDVSRGAFPGNPRFDRRYFEYINQIVQEEPVFEYDKAMMAMLASIDIEKGKPLRLDERTGRILDRAAQDAGHYDMDMLLAMKPTMMGPQFWPDRQWVTPALTRDVVAGGAQWVFPDRVDYVARSTFYFFRLGVPKRFGAQELYLLTVVDSQGNLLNGGRHYRLYLPKDVPANDFWEVIAYSPITRTYLDTPANRISVTSANPIYRQNEDGSVDIDFGPTTPATGEANWISTRPGEPYQVTLRFYGPQQRLVEKQWVASDLEEVR